MRDEGAFHFLDGGGSMAAAIRGHDWASTSLGPIDRWDAALRIAVSMMLNSSFPGCIFWGPDFISIYNDAFKPILGEKPKALGRPLREVWSEIWPTVGPIAQKAYRGEATFSEDFPVVINRHGYPEEAWFTFCYSPVRDEKGHIAGILATVSETTNKVRAEQKLHLLNAELSHRMKNLLAMVSGLAGQTLQFAASKEEAHRTLVQRLSVLAEAHSVFMEGRRSRAPMRAVIERALSPFRSGRGRISIDGAPLDLSDKQALSLALAIHELATNSIKYGALSAPAGEVAICWKAGDVGTEDEFKLVWIEKGGPPAKEPLRAGFGTRLIGEVLAADFRGKVSLTYPPEGFRCELATRMRELDSPDSPESDPRLLAPAPSVPATH
ncbi:MULTISPECIES: sensor histidine kinase [Chelativorans]|uniref:histidine kinase n=1 Tax=Chelativorans sp. (strain BNC1) TaxID=266779 RepID=Q11LZ0_CHESB|nr:MULTISPECIES: PAS domain-containing sensor histidine kinase [Chelativorans]